MRREILVLAGCIRRKLHLLMCCQFNCMSDIRINGHIRYLSTFDNTGQHITFGESLVNAYSDDGERDLRECYSVPTGQLSSMLLNVKQIDFGRIFWKRP